MIIEVGKSYRMRNGQTTKIVKQFMRDCFQADTGYAYHNGDEGTLTFGPNYPSGYDLMEEI